MMGYQSFALGMLACLGYCLLCHIPKKSIPVAAIIGGFSWLIYVTMVDEGSGKVMASFVAAAFVAIISDISSRVLKEAATIFIIPGIIPLVPGAGMYYTMIEIVNGQYSKAAVIGGETFFIAGAIALSLLLIGSVTRILHAIKRKIV
ncbi:MAG: threonine/serine exporter family protein [Anaerovoracaceae bacterium]